MKEFTSEQEHIIRDYFCELSYPQPHGEIVAAQLLAAMIASGKYELEEYPRLAEAAIRLAGLLALRFDQVTREVQETTAPKPPALDKDSVNFNSEADYDPIPF